MKDFFPSGFSSFYTFLILTGISLLAIVISAIVAWISKGKIQMPYSGYILAFLISFIVGLMGCIALESDKIHLSLKTLKTLDNWGARYIFNTSLLLNVVLCIWAWWKAKKIKKDEKDATNDNL